MKRTAGAPFRRGALVLAVATGIGIGPVPVVTPSPAIAATPVSLSGANWIWYPEGNPAQSAPAETRYLRRTFSVPAGAVSDAQFVVTGDDTVDVWLNGARLAGSPRVTDSWKQAIYVDLASVLRPGANTLAVAARNTVLSAGVIGRVHVATSGGSVDLAGRPAARTSLKPRLGPAVWVRCGRAQARRLEEACAGHRRLSGWWRSRRWPRW